LSTVNHFIPTHHHVEHISRNSGQPCQRFILAEKQRQLLMDTRDARHKK
jgi:hypothetical protein